MLDDEHFGGLVVELAAGLDADLLTLLAALGAEPLGQRQLVATRLAAQVGRRPTPAVRLALSGAAAILPRPAAARRGFGLGHLRKQQRLIGVDAVAAPAALQQGVEPLLQLGELATITPQGRQQFGDHLLEKSCVVGEFGGIENVGCRPSRRRLRRHSRRGRSRSRSGRVRAHSR